MRSRVREGASLRVSFACWTAASISPLSLALQGVVTQREDYSRANATYNAFYAAGMLLGPPISSAIFRHLGGAMMLYHLAALWTAFVVFALVWKDAVLLVVDPLVVVDPAAVVKPLLLVVEPVVAVGPPGVVVDPGLAVGPGAGVGLPLK